MSVRMSALVWESRGLTPTERIVLLAMADWANDDGECWPGQLTLAEKCDLSESTIRRTLHRLEEAGAFDVTRRYRDDGPRRSNLYLLNGLPVNLTGRHLPVISLGATGQMDADNRSTVTARGDTSLVEPSDRTVSNNNSEKSAVDVRGLATDAQVQMLSDLYKASGRWTTDDVLASWRAMSISAANTEIRALKRERERWQA